MAKSTNWTGADAATPKKWATAGNWDNGVPVAGDTVGFATGSDDCNLGAAAACASFNMLALADGTASTYTGKLTGANNLTVNATGAGCVCKFNDYAHTFGNLVCSAETAGATLDITWPATNTLNNYINHYGVATGTITYTNNLIQSVTKSVTHGSGILNFDGGAGGLSHTIGSFSGSASTSRTLAFGNAHLSVQDYFNLTNAAGLTVTVGGSSKITITARSNSYAPYFSCAATGGTVQTFDEIVLVPIAGSVLGFVDGIFTVANLTFNASAVTTKTIAFYIKNTTSPITVTSELTLKGNSVTNRLLVAGMVGTSLASGTSRSINVETATVTAENVDFRDINLVDTGGVIDLSAATGGSGDCGGNTNITFTTAETETFTGGSSNWSTSTWTGTSVNRVPLPQDTVILDGTGAHTLTIDMPRLGRLITFTAGKTPTLAFSTACTVYDGLNLTNCSSITGSGALMLQARARSGTFTLTSATKVFTNGVSAELTGSTLLFADNFSSSAALIITAASVVDASTNNVNVTTTNFTMGAGTLNMGNGTWTITGEAILFKVANETTLNCGNSTIYLYNGGSVLNNDFGSELAPSAKVYNIVIFRRNAASKYLNIYGPCTFNRLEFDDAYRGTQTLVFSSSATINFSSQFKGFNNGTGLLSITPSPSFGEAFTFNKTGGGFVHLNKVALTKVAGTPSGSWTIDHQSTQANCTGIVAEKSAMWFGG